MNIPLHTSIKNNPKLLMTAILRGMFTQVNFAPVIRYQIGWRGFKDISKERFAWTMKIAGKAGVYGVYEKEVGQESTNSGDFTQAKYLIAYFPDVNNEQELLDNYLPHAQSIAYSEAYYPKIRSLELDEEFLSWFVLGEFELKTKEGEYILCVRAQEHTKYKAKEDIKIEDQVVYLAGDMVVDIPSFELIYEWFCVIIKTFNFNLTHLATDFLQGTLATKSSSFAHRHLEQIDSEEKISVANYSSLSLQEIEPLFATVLKTYEPKEELLQTFHGSLSYNQSGSMLDSKSKPKLILLTGYLGSGKTTFLKNFLEYQNQRNNFTAIVQNEVGQVNIDGSLTGEEYLVSELQDGCVCCSIIGEFVYSIRKILSDFAPDTIIFELSGLSNPSNLLSEIEELSDLVQFDNLTCIVDAQHFHSQKDATDELVKQQILASNLIIINKQDLLTNSELEWTKTKIKSLNPKAITLATKDCQINPAMLYDMDTFDANSLKREFTQKTHTPSYTCEKIDLPSHNTQEEIREILDKKDHLFRAKGFFTQVNGKDKKRILVQYVNGNCQFEEFELPTHQENFLVCICPS